MSPIEQLAAKLTGQWDAIVGIPRGGLIVASLLGYALDVDRVYAVAFRYRRFPDRPPAVGVVLCEPTDAFGERILLVEDGTDSGTMLEAAHVVLSAAEKAIGDNIARKEREASDRTDRLVAEMTRSADWRE